MYAVYMTFDPYDLSEEIRAMGGKSDFSACRVCKEGRGVYDTSPFLFWRFLI